MIIESYTVISFTILSSCKDIIICLLIYFWLSWVFIASCNGLSLAAVIYSVVEVPWLLTVTASPVAKHRLQGLWASVTVALGLQSTGSVVVAHGLR